MDQTIFGKVKYNTASKVAIARMVDTIYSLSKFENCETDFISTKRFVETDYIQNMSKKDYEIISNLKTTWNLIINNSDIMDINTNSLTAINKYLGKEIIPDCGHFRNTDVYINGLSREHKVEPISEQLFNDWIKEVIDTKNIEKSIAIIGSEIIAKQPFLDGNKRTAFMFMNLMLIKNNIGIVNLREDIIYNEFQDVLEELFINDNKVPFIQLINDNIEHIPTKIKVHER